MLSMNDYDKRTLLSQRVRHCLFVAIVSGAALIACLSGYDLVVDGYLALLAIVAIVQLLNAMADRQDADLEGLDS